MWKPDQSGSTYPLINTTGVISLYHFIYKIDIKEISTQIALEIKIVAITMTYSFGH